MTLLERLLKTLNGHGSDVAALQATKAQLEADRAATLTEIADLNRKRRELLLADAPDSDIDKVERLLARAAIKLEKLGLAAPGIHERLITAKATAKTQAVAKHFERLVSAYQTLRDAVLAAEAAQVALMGAREAAVAEVGEHSIAGLPIFAFGGILGHGSAQAWATQNDAIIEATRASRARAARSAAEPSVHATKPAPAAATRTKAKPIDSLQHAVTPSPTPISADAMYAKPLGEDRSELRANEVRVRVLISNFSTADDQPAATRGDVRKMDRTAALRVAGSAVEIIEDPTSYLGVHAAAPVASAEGASP